MAPYRPSATSTRRARSPKGGRKGGRPMAVPAAGKGHLIRPSVRTGAPSPQVNADQIVCGASRKICALISSLFLAIHKVFLRKSTIIRTHIFSGFALADLIIVYSRGRLWRADGDGCCAIRRDEHCSSASVQDRSPFRSGPPVPGESPGGGCWRRQSR